MTQSTEVKDDWVDAIDVTAGVVEILLGLAKKNAAAGRVTIAVSLLGKARDECEQLVGRMLGND